MRITTKEQLGALFKAPSKIAVEKVLGGLDTHCRTLIAHSTFVVVSSADSQGRADVSPKGDPPGFVRVLDSQTLLIPERAGNNRLDTLYNVLENPHVGLLFLVPGLDITLRVSGRAEITRDPALLEPCALQGKTPVVGLLVRVEEAMLQCPKCILRSHLWDDTHNVDKAALPTMGQMIADQIKSVDPEAAKKRLDNGENYTLY